MEEKEYQIRKCQNCGHDLSRIVYVSEGFEEWDFNGQNWECVGKNSLTDDPHKEVICPECNMVVGIGKDFGFNAPYA